jgi:hypothetical protein
MKTTLVPLIGDIKENLYQLGLKEADSFKELEERVTRLLSTNNLLRQGQDIIARARALLKKKEESFFNDCVAVYAEGLGIEAHRYFSFLSLLEIAAHYGQVYPELKGLLPGCTTLFEKNAEGISHSRLLDWPLINFFEEKTRLYYWQVEGRPSIMNYSCEGLAPLFFQAIHASGFSVALHHKPGVSYHKDGASIFKIAFDALFGTLDFSTFKRDIKKGQSVTKWGFLALDKTGSVMAIDLDGPNSNSESFDLNETPRLIFTNIPIQTDLEGFESFLKFSNQRQNWLKDKLSRPHKSHILDLLTDITDQKPNQWLHPAATLSTVGAYHVNLTTGDLDLKEGHSALVSGDAIIRFSLASHSQGKILKEATPPSAFEKGWKKAAKAQAAFDEGDWEKAYHELQMAIALTSHPVWKEIFNFYLCVWDFKFVAGNRELMLIYKKLKKIRVPESLQDQWIMQIMRFEKKLELVPTVSVENVSHGKRELFLKEKVASKAIFEVWMKLLYPRLEILDVFTPHHK